MKKVMLNFLLLTFISIFFISCEEEKNASKNEPTKPTPTDYVSITSISPTIVPSSYFQSDSEDKVVVNVNYQLESNEVATLAIIFGSDDFVRDPLFEVIIAGRDTFSFSFSFAGVDYASGDLDIKVLMVDNDETLLAQTKSTITIN